MRPRPPTTTPATRVGKALLATSLPFALAARTASRGLCETSSRPLLSSAMIKSGPLALALGVSVGPGRGVDIALMMSQASQLVAAHPIQQVPRAACLIDKVVTVAKVSTSKEHN